MATEVVSTIRSSGGDYTSLSAWEAGEQRNLVTADEIEVAECYDDWPSGLSDTVTINGWTTDSTRYPKITVASGHRHNGTPQSGFFVKASSSGNVVVATNSNCHFEWLDVENTGTGGGISVVAGCVLRNCISKAPGSGAAAFNNSSGGASTFLTCLAYSSNWGFYSSQASSLLNCVAANCTSRGFWAGASTVVAKNCVAYSNTANYAGTFSASSTHNATSSASDDAPGGNSVTSVGSGAFVNAASNDFHLASGSALIGAGTNLYSDFTTDIDGDAWPSSGAWDIGFDYRVAGSSWSVSLTESASASDTQSHTYIITSSVSATEPASAADIITAAATVVAVLTETASADDILAAATIAEVAISAAASASDEQSQSYSADGAGSVTESASAVDTLDAATTMLRALVESASAADDLAASFAGAGAVSIEELASATDALTAAATLLVAILEAGNADDALQAATTMVRTITEEATAVDTVAGALPGSTWDVSIDELAAAVELITGYAAGGLTASPLGLRLSTGGRSARLSTTARQPRLSTRTR